MAPSVLLAYDPPNGFHKTGQTFGGSAIAVAADGKVAVGYDSFLGNASVKIYQSLAAVGGAPLVTITDPSFKFIAGIEFLNNNTLVFGENGAHDTVYSANFADPLNVLVGALAPDNSIPNLGDITVHNGIVYGTAANGPDAFGNGQNQLFRVNNNSTVTKVIDKFGSGYAGGVIVDAAGNFLLTDSGPFFGAPGSIYRYKSDFSFLDTISLAAGLGSGAVDLALDSEGDLFVSTGESLTQVDFSGGVPLVSQFGSFGAFSFPTYLAYTGSGFEPFSGNGKLLVSGFTDEAGIFVITPSTPLPPSALMALGVLPAIFWKIRRTVRR